MEASRSISLKDSLRKLKKDSVFLMRLDFTSPGTGKVAVSFTVNFEGV